MKKKLKHIKINVNGMEVEQQDFLDYLNQKLMENYKMDYSKMESQIDINKLLEEFDDFEIKYKK